VQGIKKSWWSDQDQKNGRDWTRTNDLTDVNPKTGELLAKASKPELKVAISVGVINWVQIENSLRNQYDVLLYNCRMQACPLKKRHLNNITVFA
jgi:hypothetical protein